VAEVMLASAALAAGGLVALWVVSLRLRDASVVDPFWGPGFAAIAWLSVAVAGPAPRGLLLAALAAAARGGRRA
jgi:steroid 5-alpha reductase family enzyme